MAKILIVEDDAELLSRVKDWLSRENHLVETTDNGDDGLERLRFYNFDAVILDWELPGLSGVEICRAYRNSGGKTPILMLTAKENISFKEQGFMAGADDYLTKPFTLKELSLRIIALLRRTGTYTDVTILTVGGVTMEPLKYKVSSNGQPVTLQPLEFALLEFMMRHKGQVYNGDALLNNVWGSDTDATSDTIRTYIKQLRKKLHPDNKASIIKTIHGLGYTVDEPDIS